MVFWAQTIDQLAPNRPPISSNKFQSRLAQAHQINVELVGIQLGHGCEQRCFAEEAGIQQTGHRVDHPSSTPNALSI